MKKPVTNPERRNFLLNLGEGALFMAGASFVAPQTVLPALLTRLGAGNIAIGALVVITWVGLYLPQIFAARYAQKQKWKKKWAIRWGIFQRINVLLVTIILFIFGAGSPGMTVLLILLLFTSHQVMMGISTPFWFDMFAKLTAPGLRGRLAGIRMAVAGAAALLGSFLLSELLVTFDFPYGYAIAFSITVVLQLISILLQFALIEESPSPTVGLEPLSQYFSSLKSVLKNNLEFRNFLIASMPLTIAVMPAGFFTVYGLHRFSLDDSAVGTFTLMMVIGQGTGALVNGFIADHLGNKRALISGASAMLFASLLGAVAESKELFYVVFLFMGMNLGSELMIRHNMAMEFAPAERRPTYIALMNMILSPFYISGLLGGLISQELGFSTLFGISIAFSLAGITLMILLVRDPRGRQQS